MVRTTPSRALLATAFASVLLPDAASAALTFSSSTGKLSGTISDATIPSVTTVPAAAAQLGTVGYSTDGKLIYGPFEAGFGRSATATATRDTRPPYPCESGGTYSGYCPGGIDVGTCEAGLFNSCPSGSVRTNLFMDECGGHANPYHYHTDMVCHYDPDAEGHSGVVGVMLDGRAVYGRHETTGAAPADLDACGGHEGPVPAHVDWGIPANTSVYHYHAQTKPPYLLGCYGPVNTVAECKALYAEGAQGSCDVVESVALSAAYSVDYDLWCPCYDSDYAVPSVSDELVAASAGDAAASSATKSSKAPFVVVAVAFAVGAA